MKIVKTVLQLALSAQFAFFGLSKVLGTPDMVETFTTLGYPGWFMLFTGLVELTAVGLLLLGLFNGRFTYAGAFLIAGLTIGAAFSHALFEQNVVNTLIPLVVWLENGVMIWLHDRSAAYRPRLNFGWLAG